MIFSSILTNVFLQTYSHWIAIRTGKKLHEWTCTHITYFFRMTGTFKCLSPSLLHDVTTHLPYLPSTECNVKGVLYSDLKRMWKEVIVTSLYVLSHHLPGVIEETHESPQSGLPFWGKRLSDVVNKNSEKINFLQPEHAPKTQPPPVVSLKYLCSIFLNVNHHIMGTKSVDKISGVSRPSSWWSPPLLTSLSAYFYFTLTSYRWQQIS
jgi:hypothetical protein